jgi:hypothetical protein
MNLKCQFPAVIASYVELFETIFWGLVAILKASRSMPLSIPLKTMAWNGSTLYQ